MNERATAKQDDETLKAPFPWFGGKRLVAQEVWRRFGPVDNYVEPFFGSGAVLLGKPKNYRGIETVNDLDGFVANFWRSLKQQPVETAGYADWPVNETDLHARHLWLVGQRADMTERLLGDPDWCDPKIAGWWVWGLCSWIGGGWCSGKGAWHNVEGKLTKDSSDTGSPGIARQLPHLGNAGVGVNKRSLSDDPRGAAGALAAWFQALSARLARVRVASGDWSRVLGPSITSKNGMTGVFLDPPYADKANRDSDLYACESESVAHDVRAWAIEAGKDPKMRIALCGYDGEHEMPSNWAAYDWKAHGGYGSQSDGAGRDNATRERVWFSPACLSYSRDVAKLLALGSLRP